MSPCPGDYPGRTIPDWLDPKNQHGRLFYLFLKARDGHTLPNPFLVGKSIEKHAGKIDGAFFDRIRKWYVLKIRNKEQGKKLEELKELIDGTLVEIGNHPNLNYRKFVVRCSEVIDMTEAELLAELLSQKITEVRRITKKSENKIIGTPTLVLTINSTIVPEYVDFGLLRVRTRVYIPQPLLCRLCFTYGHPKKRCPNERKCSVCSSTKHDSSNCPGPKFCHTCESHDHSPSERTCPKWIEESHAHRISVEQNLPLATARQQVKNNITKNSYANITRSTNDPENPHHIRPHHTTNDQQPPQLEATKKQQQQKRDHTTSATGPPAIHPTTPSPPRKKNSPLVSPPDSTDRVGQENNKPLCTNGRRLGCRLPAAGCRLPSAF
ncbi:uncharacterized protein LOC129752892 [Uranotaenia lowii]|uniref:uncharacterized protein LOC129752892 n=1 Tax=Uranotaenia lowii TaxID=190385 RepID=UPI00247AFA02|nr:uncharacterized protein LOC129752892 [Uranotaenia lowii]